MKQPITTMPVSEEELHAYVDDALSPARRQEVQAYLERHPEIAQRTAQWQAQRQLLRASLAPIADEPVPGRLNPAHLVAQLHRPSPWRWQMAASICLSLSIGLLGGWQLKGAAEPSSGIVALAGEAQATYQAYASGGELRLASGANNSGDLVRLVSSKISRPIVLPDLSESGYRYAGGQLVATAHGPAGMFVYTRDDGARLAMVIRPMVRDQDTPMMAKTSGVVGGFTWAAKGMGYSVVSTGSTEALHPLANEVRRQVASLLG